MSLRLQMAAKVADEVKLIVNGGLNLGNSFTRQQFEAKTKAAFGGGYLQVSAGGDDGNTLDEAVVAAARASLHLHARRPQHEVRVTPIQHRSLHLHHLRPNLTVRPLGWLRLHW